MVFDPSSLAANDEFTFETQEVIKQYLEKNFRTTIDKGVQKTMHIEHLVPRTFVMKMPKVDQFVLDHLSQCFPQSHDNQLDTLQAALQRSAGLFSCLWAELIDNELVKDEDSVMNVIRCVEYCPMHLGIVGNPNELISQARRCNILQAVDQGLEKHGKKPPLIIKTSCLAMSFALT